MARKKKDPAVHDYHRCSDHECDICSNGIALCKVCFGSDLELLEFCPGFHMNREAAEAVASGHVRDISHGFRIRIQRAYGG